MKQIICVHVGEKYSTQYVEKLYRAARRQMSDACLFTVLTDGKNYDISDSSFRTVNIQSLPLAADRMWWYKMQSFRPDVAIEGENLLLDIDIVICNSIDKFWGYHPDKFVIIQDFNRRWYPSYPKHNSSVVKFDKTHADWIYDRWATSPLEFTHRYRGDQDWFDGELSSMVRWPSSWIMSWKWEVLNGGLIESGKDRYYSNETRLDMECSILAFHGKPNPDEVKHDIVLQHWI